MVASREVETAYCMADVMVPEWVVPMVLPKDGHLVAPMETYLAALKAVVSASASAASLVAQMVVVWVPPVAVR